MLQVDICARKNTESMSSSLPSKHSAIRNKKAVPNREPILDRDDEQVPVKAKIKTEQSPKAEPPSKDKTCTKSATGIQGLFEKQKDKPLKTTTAVKVETAKTKTIKSENASAPPAGKKGLGSKGNAHKFAALQCSGIRYKNDVKHPVAFVLSYRSWDCWNVC